MGRGTAGFELGSGKAVTGEVRSRTMAKTALALEVFSCLSDLVG